MADSMTLQQFGQTIKAKHPEYADLGDEEVANRVIAKYPQYKDMVQTSSAPQLGTLSDTLQNIWEHAKNVVTGPVQAFTQPPQDQTEMAIGGPTAGGQGALGLYRMFVKPTVQGIGTAYQQGKQGNYFSKSEYDPQGNYTPSMVSSIADAIPIAGPWSRNIETEARQKGIMPALAGFGTDLAAPKVLAKGGGLALQGAGRGLQMASSTAPALRTAVTRALVPGTPAELLQSGLKPNARYGAGAGQMLESSLPDVLAADPNTQGVSGFARASDVARQQAFQPYNDIMAQYRTPESGIGPVRPGAVSGEPIGTAINKSIPAINRFESPKPVGPPSDWTATRPNTTPGIIQSTAERAAKYNRDIPVAGEAGLDEIRMDANAKLNAFYNKAGGDQAAALSNPETAAIKAIGDTARQQLYPFLEQEQGLPSGAINQMQQKYGTLVDVSDIANKREPIVMRHDPVSLSQKIVVGHGGPITRATNYLANRLLTKTTNPDALVNAAIDRYRSPSAPSLPARPGVMPAMGSGLGSGLYGAGQALRQVPMKFNPFAIYAATNPPRQ